MRVKILRQWRQKLSFSRKLSQCSATVSQRRSRETFRLWAHAAASKIRVRQFRIANTTALCRRVLGTWKGFREREKDLATNHNTVRKRVYLRLIGQSFRQYSQVVKRNYQIMFDMKIVRDALIELFLACFFLIFLDCQQDSKNPCPARLFGVPTHLCAPFLNAEALLLVLCHCAIESPKAPSSSGVGEPAAQNALSFRLASQGQESSRQSKPAETGTLGLDRTVKGWPW